MSEHHIRQDWNIPAEIKLKVVVEHELGYFTMFMIWVCIMAAGIIVKEATGG